jgi:cytochrome c oxidase cbb3-type subunit 1
MIGGTGQGMSWLAGNAFMESVTLMAPFWLWRAVGGTLMFLSHLIFAWNIWQMRPQPRTETVSAPAEAQGVLA